MTIDNLIKHAKFTLDTLNSQCVECEKKAKDFYKSVIENLEVLEIIKNAINKYFNDSFGTIELWFQYIKEFNKVKDFLGIEKEIDI